MSHRGNQHCCTWLAYSGNAAISGMAFSAYGKASSEINEAKQHLIKQAENIAWSAMASGAAQHKRQISTSYRAACALGQP